MLSLYPHSTDTVCADTGATGLALCCLKVMKRLLGPFYSVYIGCTIWAPYVVAGHKNGEALNSVTNIVQPGQRILKVSCGKPPEVICASQPTVVMCFHHSSLSACQNKTRTHPCRVRNKDGRWNGKQPYLSSTKKESLKQGGMVCGVAMAMVVGTNLTGREIEPREAHQSACTL